MNEDKKNISNIGGLVGKASGVKIVDSWAEGTITINGLASNVGGLVGSADNVEIENSSANMEIIIIDESKVFFDELRETLEQIKIVEERQILFSLVDEMEDSVGKPTFKDKYRSFVASAADHMTLLSPFVVRLTEYIL